MDIKEHINENKLNLINNKLECICLFVINNEVENGQYKHFLNQIKDTVETTSVNYYFSQKLHFKIITNLDSIDISFLVPLFSSVEVIKLDCPQEPINKSNVFFQSFEYLVQYNTTLFLGCDCYFSKDWLEKIYNYTRFSGSFWISGGLYDDDDDDDDIINCFFALYSTGDYSFLSFIKFVLSVSYSKDLPHDVLIKKVISDKYHQDCKINKFITRHYICNNLIFSYKKDIDIFGVRSLYNKYCILNKNITEESQEKEIKKIKNIPSNFDYNFYFSRYPETKSYFLEYSKNNNIPDSIRAYHHYINYGKDFGYCMNESDCNLSVRNFDIEDIDKY